MSNLNNSFDYNVKLLGLLPIHFDFAKEENFGVRFQTDNLRKVKKPSEDQHEGEMVNDAQLFANSAVVEAKIIRHNDSPTNASNRETVSDEDDDEMSDSKSKINDEVGGDTTNASNRNVVSDEESEETSNAPDAKLKVSDDGQDVIPPPNESFDKLKIKESPQSNDVREDADDKHQTKDEQSKQAFGEDDKNTKSDDDDSTEPVDQTMKEDLSAIFLYKSYYDVNCQQPDFVTYRLPLMFLAIKHDPYFFKVNKIRFKPYGCENEMEFIQMKWPIQLNELYRNPKYDASTHRGWSGVMFNEWATTTEAQQKPSPSSSASASNPAARGGDDGGDVDTDEDTTYHRAYIQAKIKPKIRSDERDFSDSTRGFNILITALVGGVWDLEADPINYTCENLAEMRTVQEETLYQNSSQYFYEKVRMQSNYWQCYLAGETNYLVGVNGPISGSKEPKEEETKKRRQINELRLYDVSKIPDFIKKFGAEHGFRPWSKEVLQNRLYKSLHVIYDKVKGAPVDTEFMFVKYNQFDPPIHDVDGSLTGPHMLAFKQLIIEGLPTPPQPKLVTKLMVLMNYGEMVEDFLDRKFKREDVPKQEDKGDCIILTFESEILRLLFLHRCGSMLRYMKEKNKFPANCGMENLSIEKVFMEKPVSPGGNNSQSWRSSNHQQQYNTFNSSRAERTQSGESTQSWRISNNQHAQSNSPNYENNWRRGADSAGDNFQSGRSSNQQHQQHSNFRNNNWRQDNGSANFREQSRNMDDNRRQRYGGRTNEEQNWRRK